MAYKSGEGNIFFDGIKPAAEKLGLKVDTFENFTLKEIPKGLSHQIIEELSSMKPKTLSSPIEVPNGISYIYVAEKTLPELDSEDKEWQDAMKNMEMINSMLGSYTLSNQLIEKELK